MQIPEWLDVEKLSALLTTWGLKVLAALAVLLIGWLIVTLLVRGLARSLGRSRMDVTLVTFLTKIAYAILFAVLIIIVLTQVGVQMTAALAVLGAAGLAIALSLQGSLSNFASGVMLISARPMKVGDFVECAGVSGVVDHVGIFYTQLHTTDNQIITICNSQVLEQPIINYSAQNKRRFNETIGIGYDDDIKKAKQTIEQVLAAESRLLDDPPPEILVNALGPNSVDLSVRCWTETGEFGDVRSDLLENLKAALDAAGISIPFPQQDVHLFKHKDKEQAA